MIKKQLTALFFIYIMALPLFNALSLFVKQWQLKIEMAHQLENTKLQQITVPINEVIWVEKNKEIFVYGQLFDIKTIVHQSSEKITVAGLYDNEENEIWQKVDKANNPYSEKQILLMLYLKQHIGKTNYYDLVFKTIKSQKITLGAHTSQFLPFEFVNENDKPPC